MCILFSSFILLNTNAKTVSKLFPLMFFVGERKSWKVNKTMCDLKCEECFTTLLVSGKEEEESERKREGRKSWEVCWKAHLIKHRTGTIRGVQTHTSRCTPGFLAKMDCFCGEVSVGTSYSGSNIRKKQSIRDLYSSFMTSWFEWAKKPEMRKQLEWIRREECCIGEVHIGFSI